MRFEFRIEAFNFLESHNLRGARDHNRHFLHWGCRLDEKYERQVQPGAQSLFLMFVEGVIVLTCCAQEKGLAHVPVFSPVAPTIHRLPATKPGLRTRRSAPNPRLLWTMTQSSSRENSRE